MLPKTTMRNAAAAAGPPWQVLDLVSHRLDPETLAAASCVSKSWATSLSADHLWQPLCSATFPSLTNLRSAASPAGISFRKLYSLGRAAEGRRRRRPIKPHLSIHDLVFAVDIRNGRGCVATVVTPGGDLKPDRAGIFRFDIDVDSDPDPDAAVAFGEVDELVVTWNVVLQGFKGVFRVMDCSGKGSFVLGLEGWFSKELPAAGCCGGGGMVGDLRLGLKESGGKVVVEKMSLGILSIVSWRYVGMDDALRYLQHFLLPCM